MPYLDKTKNRWRVNIRLAGRRKSKLFPVGTPKKIAEDYERKLKLELIDPKLSSKHCSDLTFARYAEKWLKECCKVQHSFAYHLKCTQSIRDHLNPKIGHLIINTVTSADLMELQRELRQKDYAVQSINNLLAVASSIFKQALLENHVTGNPCAGIKRLKKGQRPELEVWTIAERDRFLSTVYQENFKLFQVCAVALFTGLRPSEIRGLLRDAIDFERGQVRVFRQWCTKQNKLVNYTKTREARIVPVPSVILNALSDKRDLAGDIQLFPFMTSSFGHTVLKPLMAKANVKAIRMHDFRHTFASHMLFQGASLLEVKELLGHRKLESTIIYLHYMPDRNKGATERLVSGASWQAKDNVIPLAL